MAAPSSPSPLATDPPPPPATAILILYIVLGSILSFLAGREPGTLPDNILKEVGPTLAVICGFLVSYSLYDVMAVGVAKHKYPALRGKPYNDVPPQEPEEVYLAQRVLTNQVEQMPAFIVGSISCAILVNGTVAALLALIWAILRRGYATTYRNGVGLPMKQIMIGLGKFTIPAYFCVNAMLMASAIHALRAIVSG